MCRFLGLRTRLGEREQARMCQAFLGSTLIKFNSIVRFGSANALLSILVFELDCPWQC